MIKRERVEFDLTTSKGFDDLAGFIAEEKLSVSRARELTIQIHGQLEKKGQIPSFGEVSRFANLKRQEVKDFDILDRLLWQSPYAKSTKIVEKTR